jgi:hypothetical protein
VWLKGDGVKWERWPRRKLTWRGAGQAWETLTTAYDEKAMQARKGSAARSLRLWEKIASYMRGDLKKRRGELFNNHVTDAFRHNEVRYTSEVQERYTPKQESKEQKSGRRSREEPQGEGSCQEPTGLGHMKGDLGALPFRGTVHRFAICYEAIAGMHCLRPHMHSVRT